MLIQDPPARTLQHLSYSLRKRLHQAHKAPRFCLLSDADESDIYPFPRAQAHRLSLFSVAVIDSERQQAVHDALTG